MIRASVSLFIIIIIIIIIISIFEQKILKLFILN